jgi:hypothetical protein
MITANQYLKRYPADEQFVGPDATVFDILKSDVQFNHKASLFAEVYVENPKMRHIYKDMMRDIAAKYPQAVTPVVTDKSQEQARKAYFNLEMYEKNLNYGTAQDAQKFHLHAALNIMDKIGLNRLDQMIEIVEAIQKGGRV